jgi:hypothetical protein
MISYQELGLEEGDWITYLPTNQFGIIKRIWIQEEQSRYELKLFKPDCKKWVDDPKEIKLVYPVG